MHSICVTCGTQYADAPDVPTGCAICEDERQFIGWSGQQWTTLEELRQTRHSEIREEEPGLVGIGAAPSFAIGQRALLLRAPAGNVLWDCIPFIDDAAVAAVRELGGIDIIAISHPHFYSAMVEWADVFDARILLHVADREWVMRPDPRIEFWDGDARSLHGDVTLIRCGGHFEGGTVLHWPAGADGRGALLVGDILMVGQDRRHVSFMRSYPNLIPLPPRRVRSILTLLDSFAYDRIWSGWWSSRILDNAKEAVRRSADRYIRAVTTGA